MEWIKEAANRVEQHPTTTVKSFQVTGIVWQPDCTRSDALYEEIQEAMTNIFGQEHIGCMEPTEDPFSSLDSEIENAPTQLSTSDPPDTCRQ